MNVLFQDKYAANGIKQTNLFSFLPILIIY